MNFDLNHDQLEIKQTARSLLADRYPSRCVHENAESGRYDETLWAELIELGWSAITVGERYGGLGLGVVEAMCLAEEVGYSLAATPFIPNAAAALVLEACGSEDQRDAWLPRLASGDALGTVGLANGRSAALVADAGEADLIILIDDSAASLLEATEASVESVETMDRNRRYARIEGEGTPMSGDGAAGLARAEILFAAENVGLCRRALDLTVAFTSEREQFGKPIGSFQAIAHRCADMLLDTESARSATYFGAWSADADDDQLERAAAMALAVSSESARNVTASSIQAHGGIGFTWEADLHWYLKRAHVNSMLLGSPSDHWSTAAQLK